MKSRELVTHGGERTYALVFDKGDEAKSGIERFARERGLSAAHFTGIGAFSDVTLGYFDWERKDYERIPIDAQVEVAALVGDIASEDGEAQVHAHLVVGDAHGRAFAGHLLEGHVRPTLEIVLTETPAELRKVVDPETGLALIDLEAPTASR
jgi:predicted DNA-binding protein with PD1-like motif